MMESVLYSVKDIMKIMEISSATAYRIASTLNSELRNMKNEKGAGYYTFGSKVYSKYFKERLYDNRFLKTEKIQECLKIKKHEAQKIVMIAKQELTEKGYLFVKGRVPERYFLEKLYKQ